MKSSQYTYRGLFHTIKLAIGIFSILSLFACTPPRTVSNELSNMTSDVIKESVQKNAIARDSALEREYSGGLKADLKPKSMTAKKNFFDLHIKYMPVANLVVLLGKLSKTNVVIADNVDHNLLMSLDLKQVDLEQALGVIKDKYKLEINTKDYGYLISKEELETKTYNLPKSNVQKQSGTVVNIRNYSSKATNSKSTNSKNQLTGTGGIATTFANSNYWTSAKDTIAQMLSKTEGSFVSLDEEVGLITVRDLPSNQAEIAKFIKRMILLSSKQVLIEAKIVEVGLSDAFSTGIDWSQKGLSLASSTGKATVSFPVKFKNISATLTALETQGSVNVLSNPRISVMNNEPAIINVGSDRFYVTDVTFGTTSVGGAHSQFTSSVDLTPFFSGISLNVIPRVDEYNNIELYVNLRTSEVESEDKSITLSSTQQLSLPTANITSRETDSSIRIDEDQVLVLGGMISGKSTATDKSPPWFGKLGMPLDRSHTNNLSELVILLQARVVNTNDWYSIMQSTESTFDTITQATQSR